MTDSSREKLPPACAGCSASVAPQVPGLLILRPGTRCVLDKGRTGVVLEVRIAGQIDISYCVGWWDGAKRHCAWLMSSEVRADGAQECWHLGPV